MFKTIGLTLFLTTNAAPPNLHVDVDQKQLACLTEAVYFEAGFEPYQGKIRVAEVIINRVNDKSKLYPKDICSVINQPSRNKTKPKACQFSYTCNSKSKYMKNDKIRIIARTAAISVMINGVKNNTIKHFARCEIKRSWMKNMRLYEKIGKHCFYEQIKSASIYIKLKVS